MMKFHSDLAELLGDLFQLLDDSDSKDEDGKEHEP